MLASAEAIRKDVAALFRAPRRIRPSEAAAKSLFDHHSGNLYDPKTAPYMAELLDTLASREHEVTVVVGPSRSSKSFTMVLGGLTYIITCDPADTTILHMHQMQATKWSKTELTPTFDASEDLAAELGTGSRANNISLKLLRNGMSLSMGYPSIGCVSASTLRYVFITDADNLSGDLSLSALFPLATKRTTTFMSAGHTVVEGNPAEDYADVQWEPAPGSHEGPPATGLVSLYNSGDRRRFYWPCPHCGEYFQALPGLAPFKLIPDIEELKALAMSKNLAEVAQRLAVVVCPASGCEIRHDSKQEMNLRGRWLREGQTIDRDGVIHGEGNGSKIASAWVAGVMAAYQSWPSMLVDFLQAVRHYATTGEDTQIKQRMNTDFAWPHLPYALRSRKAKHALQERAEEYEKLKVPEGVRYLICCVDVQHHAFVVQVTGYGANDQRWLVDRYKLETSERPKQDGGFHKIDPASYQEDWDILTDKCVDRQYELGDGSKRRMNVLVTLIDSAGEKGVTIRAKNYWQSLAPLGLKNKMRLSKGDGNLNSPRVLERYPDTRSRGERESGFAGDVPVLFYNVTIVKDVVMGNMDRPEYGPGYYHFPAWIAKEKWFFDEITAEKRGPKRWECPPHVRNEALDLFCMAEVGHFTLGGDKIDWDKHNKIPSWARPWDLNSEVRTGARLPAPRPAKPAQRRGTRSSGVY